MNYSKEEWIYIFKKYNILEKVKLGTSYKALAIDLKENGYPCSSEAIRKAVNRYYLKSEEQNLYYLEYQEPIIKYMNSIDIEATTDEISSLRYYSCFDTPFWERDNSETVSVNIDKEIFEEYKQLSREFGCDFDEEYMIAILLKHLSEIRPKDKTREFILRAMNENNEIVKEEIDFILAKEKEGYKIDSLYFAATDFNIMELSEEEFKKQFKYCRKK